tara:strand:- start:137 stop:319 length:183 start_codon:yes stop_codon:yes gene_type:complete
VFKRTPFYRKNIMKNLIETTQETLEELDLFQGEDIKLMEYVLELEKEYNDLMQGIPIDNS